MSHPLIQSDLPLPNRRQGKVRDLYDLPPRGLGGEPRVLIVATDRISAFDVVMPQPIDGKGRLLTQVSLRWFEFIERRGLARTHLLSSDWREVIGAGTPPMTEAQARPLEGRVMIGRRCRIVPIECVARGYLDGSGWSEYAASGAVCGVRLPPGLRRGDRLPEPIFTPATKEAVGTHDENIDFDRACERADRWMEGRGSGRRVMELLREITLKIYAAAHEHAAARGLILADTKFEFGFPDQGSMDQPILCDEVLTPDSSRYWDASKWKPGGEQPSFDKQFLREYLNGLVTNGQWNKQAPGPALPAEVIAGTRDRYEEVGRRLFDSVRS